MREVMRLVGRSPAPDLALHKMLHLMSELLGLNRGRIVLIDASAFDPTAPGDGPRPLSARRGHNRTGIGQWTASARSPHPAKSCCPAWATACRWALPPTSADANPCRMQCGLTWFG